MHWSHLSHMHAGLSSAYCSYVFWLFTWLPHKNTSAMIGLLLSNHFFSMFVFEKYVCYLLLHSKYYCCYIENTITYYSLRNWRTCCQSFFFVFFRCIFDIFVVTGTMLMTRLCVFCRDHLYHWRLGANATHKDVCHLMHVI